MVADFAWSLWTPEVFLSTDVVVDLGLEGGLSGAAEAFSLDFFGASGSPFLQLKIVRQLPP
jgi:hypothetical protein